MIKVINSRQTSAHLEWMSPLLDAISQHQAPPGWTSMSGKVWNGNNDASIKSNTSSKVGAKPNFKFLRDLSGYLKVL